jgi:hypothetical protein
MTEKTFSELFCERRGLPAERYAPEVLACCLYPHARKLAKALLSVWPDFFVADLDFVRAVGRLRRFRDFSSEAEEFAHHPANRGFWRRYGRVRVSSRLLRHLLRAELHPEMDAMPMATATETPFAGVVPAARGGLERRSDYRVTDGA